MRAKAFSAALVAATALVTTAASADGIKGLPTYEDLGYIEFFPGQISGSITYSTGPTYYEPAPVYRQPAPVYQQKPVYKQPAPIVLDYGKRYDAPVRPGKQIRNRLRNQQDRIARAVQRGDLTNREQRRLERRDQEIRAAFRQARHDGRGIGPREQGYLNALLDEQSQRIRRMVRNHRRADVYVPRHDYGSAYAYGQPVYRTRP